MIAPPIQVLKKVAAEALAAWDADRDSRVGKLLAAMAGRLPGYRADIDQAHAALSAAPETAAPPHQPREVELVMLRARLEAQVADWRQLAVESFWTERTSALNEAAGTLVDILAGDPPLPAPPSAPTPSQKLERFIETVDEMRQVVRAPKPDKSGVLIRAMFAALDVVKQHIGGFDNWPIVLKDAFSEAIIDRTPLTESETARTRELAERFGWETSEHEHRSPDGESNAPREQRQAAEAPRGYEPRAEANDQDVPVMRSERKLQADHAGDWPDRQAVSLLPNGVVAPADAHTQASEQLARFIATVDEMERVVRGFKHQAENGVICVPMDNEHGIPQWNAKPSRTWCIRCCSLWSRLFAAVSKQSEIAADAHTPAPASWTCFHCAETFIDETEARDHFGAREDATAACQIAGSDGGILKALRKSEQQVGRLREANEQLDHEAGAYHAMSSELERYFGKGVRSAHHAWLRLEAAQNEAEMWKDKATPAPVEAPPACRFMRPAPAQPWPCAQMHPGDQAAWCGACLLASMASKPVEAQVADYPTDFDSLMEHHKATEAALDAMRAERDEDRRHVVILSASAALDYSVAKSAMARAFDAERERDTLRVKRNEAERERIASEEECTRLASVADKLQTERDTLRTELERERELCGHADLGRDLVAAETALVALQAEHAALCKDYVALALKLAALRERLEQIEWSGTIEHVHGCCPLCSRFAREGHEADCLLSGVRGGKV